MRLGQRVLVIGPCGAGKSTFSRALGQRLGRPVIHLDQLFWLPGWRCRTQQDFEARQRQALAAPQWIMDGSFGRTLSLRLAYADQVIALVLPRWQCMARVVRRALSRQVRPDMADGCPERLERAFLRYAWRFERDELPGLQQTLSEHAQVPVLWLRRASEVAWLLATAT